MPRRLFPVFRISIAKFDIDYHGSPVVTERLSRASKQSRESGRPNGAGISMRGTARESRYIPKHSYDRFHVTLWHGTCADFISLR